MDTDKLKDAMRQGFDNLLASESVATLNMGTLLAEYLKQLLHDDGESDDVRSFAYRGQLDAGWALRSSAYRRLSQFATSGASGGIAVSEDRQIEYNSDLLDSFRNRRFDTMDGVRFTDLEALCQLQHLGAATSLIDFSRNPLVALWFACENLNTDGTSQPDGAVFKVNTTYSLDIDPGRLDNGTGPTFAEILDQRLIPPHDLLAWEPPSIASAQERVVAQHSVLLLGRPLMSPNPSDQRIKKIPVSQDDKQQLRRELAAVGIGASTLFPDLHGFASTNGADYPVLHVSTKNLLEHGISAYNEGDAVVARHKLASYITKRPNDWASRLLLSNVLVDIEEYGEALKILDAAEQTIDSLPAWQHHMLYANRANTKAAMGDHEDAVNDYTLAFQLGKWGIDDMLYLNRGNSNFALGRFQEALADFEACESSVVAAHNAGNTCIALGQLSRAKAKFAEAQNSPKSPTQTHENMEAVTRVVSLIGTDQCEVEVRHGDVSNTSRFLRVVIRSDRLTNGPQLFPIAGNTGNKGNFGWSKIGEWLAAGSQGFSGSDGMIVEVQAALSASRMIG